MESTLLPPGFRFHPTDEELVGHYLKRKVDGLDIELEVIPVIDFYKFDPWELPDKSFLPKRDMEWFFFCPRDRKYPNGSRTNRATVSGYWKATGKDRKVNCESCVFGLRKTLVFYIGRAPGGERTDWIMHEYRLCEDLLHGSSNFLGAFALCRVVKRNGNWLKSSDQHAEFRATKKPLTSSMFDSSRKRDFDEVLNGAKESLPLDPFDKSYCSSPMNSPEAAKETSDASKDSAMEEGGAPLSLDGIPTPIEAFPPYTHSPAPFEMNNTHDESLLIDGHGSNCLSSFPSPAHCMGMCSSWEVITFQSLQLDSTRYVDASCNGTETFNVMVPPPICRQASEGEEVNLWLKEDHTMIVM